MQQSAPLSLKPRWQGRFLEDAMQGAGKSGVNGLCRERCHELFRSIGDAVMNAEMIGGARGLAAVDACLAGGKLAQGVAHAGLAQFQHLLERAALTETT